MVIFFFKQMMFQNLIKIVVEVVAIKYIQTRKIIYLFIRFFVDPELTSPETVKACDVWSLGKSLLEIATQEWY